MPKMATGLRRRRKTGLRLEGRCKEAVNNLRDGKLLSIQVPKINS
jgi:hypothetical protein